MLRLVLLDAVVGLKDGSSESLLGFPHRTAQLVLQSFSRQIGCDLSGNMATQSVANRKKSQLTVCQPGILIIGPD